MKKLLFTTLFIVFAMTLGFSQTNNEGQGITTTNSSATPYYIPSDYTLIPYFIGDVNAPFGSWNIPITVNYSGSYVGKSANLGWEGGYTFYWDGDENVSYTGPYSHIGDVYTNQNGRFVIYQILANVIR